MLREDENAVLLVPNYSQAKRISEQYDIPKERILSADPVVLRGLPMSNKYLVDNIDQVLSNLLGVPVDTGTVSS